MFKLGEKICTSIPGRTASISSNNPHKKRPAVVMSKSLRRLVFNFKIISAKTDASTAPILLAA